MRILLVDDESDVLVALMAIMKTMPGHQVRVAANAQKAHEHAAALGGVDLLVSDVVMEPTDGFTLRAELQALYPEMQTVFVSGYDLSEHAGQLGGVPVLAKPVDADVLRRMIGSFEERLAAMAMTPAPTPRVAVAQPAAVQAQATAVPRAVPQASSAPRPMAVQPAAVPVAAAPQPTVHVASHAVPQAQPVATPQPAAVPRPVAIQSGVAPRPTVAAPAPPPTVRAAAPQPVSGVRAAAPTALRPAPQAVAVSAPAAAVPVAATPVVSNDPLIGVQLGDYRVQQLLGRGGWGKHYAALQLSVNRRVGLNVLDPEMAQEEHNRMHFLADARAKAAVQHPFIVSVFEADEQNGLVFYTHESLDGATMQERIERGQFLDEKTALQVLKVAAEGLQYLWSRNLAHGPLDASGLRVGADNIARLANLATAESDPSVTMESEIRTLGAIIQQLVAGRPISNGLRAFLARMTGGPNPVTSWPVVLQAVKALEPKVIPVEAAKIKAADDAAMRALEAASTAKKRALYISVATLAALCLVMGFVLWKFVVTNARKLDAQILIPSGNYIVGSPEDARKAPLGTYEIDKYEVTIGDYAKFIAWCERNPLKEHDFDHPRGERRTSHVDRDVKTLIQNAEVRGGRVFKPAGDPGAEIDLNCPIVGVTFWDAYAYARWRGTVLDKDNIPRDLPTEEEWEAAARGTKGYTYPWGDELKVKNFNSNEGYTPQKPGSTKTADGYNFWAPVDAFSSDESGFKVVGMAGNVCEWVYRKEGSTEIPLLKGGSFATDPIPMWGRILKIPAEDAWFIWPAAKKPKATVPPAPDDTRIFVGDDLMPSTRALYIGFRTVKRK